MIGPGLFTFSFAFAISPARSWHMPGAPFLLATAMLATALLLVYRRTDQQPVSQP
jgi:DHA1 family tetracycline resistance protein-like MFS transporter